MYAYWAAYWPVVVEYAPLIGLQLVFAYAFDALISLTRRREWIVSFGPIPVVLSANLFVWFPMGETWLALVVVALALGSKALLTRGGRHIVNPSAFGVAVVGAACMAFPDVLPYWDIAHYLNLPPHMMEVVLLLALIPQARVPIVLVSLAAFMMMNTLVWDHPPLRPDPAWAPVLLALVLLATDPSTIPKRGAGRVLFGLLLGGLIVLISTILELNGISDFYGKVLPIPLLNACAPWLDRQGARLPARLQAALEPRWNLAHMAVWLAFFAFHIQVGQIKASTFEARMHLENQTRFVVQRPSGPPRCDDNPMFCEPFSLRAELEAWLGQPTISSTRKSR